MKSQKGNEEIVTANDITTNPCMGILTTLMEPPAQIITQSRKGLKISKGASRMRYIKRSVDQSNKSPIRSKSLSMNRPNTWTTISIKELT